MSNFSFDEIDVISKLWLDLTEKSYGNGIGIDTNIFKLYTDIDGFLGERLFVMFDKGNNKFITLNDFIDGLELLYFGSTENKAKFLFSIFDVKNSGIIEKEYMKIILNSIPHKIVCSCIHNHDVFQNNYDNWTNNCVCQEAFCYNNEDIMTLENFKMWQNTNHIVIDYIKNKINYFVPKTINIPKKVSKSKSDILPMLEKTNRFESYLFKKSKYFNINIKRYYMLYGNCLYYYINKSSIKPKGVLFMNGSNINKINNKLEITFSGAFKHKKRVLFGEKIDEWFNRLKSVSRVILFDEQYNLGNEIGKGAFGTVHKCVRKYDGKLYAVKIISKKNLNDRMLFHIRNELSILKLVCHPNIIHMDSFYETDTTFYFVFDFIEGGDLLTNIEKRNIFNVKELKEFIKNMSECLAYLHELGIIHRDIKPENILCDNNRLILTDFGLSEFLLPETKLYEPCGTIDYVAPEVINQKGYSKESDIWSLGVISYLLYYGKMPFNAENNEEILLKIVNEEPYFDEDKNLYANNLLIKMLDKNPKTRITAQEILSNYFIISYY